MRSATPLGPAPPPDAIDRDLPGLAAVVVLGMVMAILDATIVNVAVPTLGDELDASISTVQWVVTAYLLALASVIPLGGWATARLGTRRVWIGALVLFTAGSTIAGLAPSVEVLIAARVVQGAGAGLIMPVGQAILAQAAGPARIGRVMSVVGIPMLLAPILGPVVGGAIVDEASWHWIFFVNLPVGAAAVAAAVRRLPAGGRRPGARLDLRGLALLPPGIALAVYGLSEVGAAGAAGTRALAWIAVGLALVALFVLHALRRRREALIDVSLFARRGLAAAAATNLFVGVALFGALILLPLYYGLVRGESPLATGLLLVPQGVGAALAMPIAGRLTDEVGARAVIPVGILLALAGTAAYTQVGADTSYLLLGGALFTIGLGLGATVMPSMAVAYQSVPQEAVGHATSAVNVIQRVAASIGTALLAVVLQHSMAAEVPGAGGGIGAFAALPAGRRADAAPGLAHAFGTTFWVAVGLVAAALVPALLLPRRPAQRSHEPARIREEPVREAA